VPIRTRPDLWRLAPRFDAIVSAGAPHGLQGIFAFTRDTVEARSATHARYFAPAQGVPEDPVTGAAHGPLAAHLCSAGYLPLAPEQDVLVLQGEQGDVLGRPGRVAMRVRRTGRAISEVLIGGTAVTVGTHQMDPGRV
jgi:trans-2,3-dihydro-3-hydroxyanthranilate isomerase